MQEDVTAYFLYIIFTRRRVQPFFVPIFIWKKSGETYLKICGVTMLYTMVKIKQFKKGHSKVVDKLNKITKKVIAMIPEKKYAGTTLGNSFSSISSSWSELMMCGPIQGVNFSERIGRKIRISGYEVRGVLTEGSVDGIADDIYNNVRIVIGLYNAGSQFPLTDASTSINHPIESMLNTKGRLIKKYYDKYIGLTTTGKGATGYCPTMKSITIRKFFKKPIVVEYGTDTNVYGDKMLIMSMISDSIGVPNPGFTCGYFRVWYTDS